VVPTTSVEYFGVIHHPDNKGKDCDFRPHSIKLPFPNQLTRVYYPNYRTGLAPICDSTIRFVTNNSEIRNYLKTISVYPNPATEELQILLSGTLNYKSQIELINHLGQTVIKNILEPGTESLSLKIQQVAPGIYLLKLEDKNGLIGLEKVIIQ
jgi:hypothetical protein